jgi:hypothetical protein
MGKSLVLFSLVNHPKVSSELVSNGFTDEEVSLHSPFPVIRSKQAPYQYAHRKVYTESSCSLIAAYVHRRFIDGLIWKIYSFDQ